jgi:hypothetical protein
MATGPITAIDGAGGNQAPPVRVRTDVLARERLAANSAQPPQTPNAIASAATAAPLHLSTRIALDPKTLRAYIQTVADLPDDTVIHSYPAPQSADTSSRLIILA